MNIIAIDCGASYIKYGLFYDDKMVKCNQVKSPLVKDRKDIFLSDGLDELVSIILGVLKEYGDGLDDVIVSIDTEMHGFILAYEDGRPYTGYLSWQYELISTDEVVEYLQSKVGCDRAEEMIKRTGMPIRGGLPSSMLLYLRKQGYLSSPEKLYFYTLGDYIIKRVTNIEPKCHPTNAAATGLYDIKIRNWNKSYISLITDGNVIFPEVGDEALFWSDSCGRDYQFLPAIGDQQAALLGAGMETEYDLSVNMGTGAQVSRLVKVDAEFGAYQLRPYFGEVLLKTIPHIPCGRAINVYYRFLKSIVIKMNISVNDDAIWKMMSESVSVDSINNRCIECDLSFFENVITDHKEASIFNITEYDFTIEQLMSAVFRRMKDNFISTINAVNVDLPAYNKVIFSGGVARRWDVLRESVVLELNSDVNVIVSSNDTLTGCMKYAFMNRKEVASKGSK